MALLKYILDLDQEIFIIRGIFILLFIEIIIRNIPFILYIIFYYSIACHPFWKQRYVSKLIYLAKFYIYIFEKKKNLYLSNDKYIVILISCLRYEWNLRIYIVLYMSPEIGNNISIQNNHLKKDMDFF